jgi:hypothetical protein
VTFYTDPSQLSDQAAAGLRAALLGFRTVTFVAISLAESRLMFSSLDHFAVRYNRALPLWSPNANFQLLPEIDPRSGTAEEVQALEYYLERVAVGTHPVGMVAHWMSMERAFGVLDDVVSEKRVALAYNPNEFSAPSAEHGLRSASETREYVAAEAAEWQKRFKVDGTYTSFSLDNPDLEASEARLSIPNAVGFWLVPVDSFGPVPEGGVTHVSRDSNLVLNLSSHLPQLALFDLAA